MIKANTPARMSLFSVLLILFIFPVFNNAAAQDTKRIYDGRLSPRPGIILPSEQALLKEKAIPAARAWQQQSDSICTGGDEAAVDIAREQLSFLSERVSLLTLVDNETAIYNILVTAKRSSRSDKWSA